MKMRFGAVFALFAAVCALGTGAQVIKGRCGFDVMWSLDTDNGAMEIYKEADIYAKGDRKTVNSGRMYLAGNEYGENYNPLYADCVSYREYADMIETVTVSAGVENVASMAFEFCTSRNNLRRRVHGGSA